MKLALLALALGAAAASRAEWKMDRFMISPWGGPTDEASAAAYADAGFNVVMADAGKLDLCARHGLSVLVMSSNPETAARLAGNPAVWGWFVRDEPKDEEFEATAKPVAAFHQADAGHPAYVDLMAWMNLKRYIEVVRPRFLSYDYYQWWWGTENQFGRLEEHRRAALDAGLPLICWVEANADPRWESGRPGATYLPDNPQKLRQSVYTALAYGVKGIQWFVESLIFEKPAEAGQGPKLTRAGEDIRAINGELQALGPVLVGLTSTDVFHTDPVPAHARAVPAEAWVNPEGEQMTVGLFRDAGGGRYAMVVNRDTERGHEARLRFGGGVGRVERFDVARRRWVAVGLTPDAAGPTVALRLKRADARLLRVR
jgi:hypothetical protein